MQLPNPMKKGQGEDGNGKQPQLPTPAPFLSNLLTLIIVFLLFAWGYSYFTDHRKTADNSVIPLSQLALDIHHQAVSEVKVDGDALTVIYHESDPATGKSIEKTAKKELESSLTETFKNFGLTAEDLATFKLTLVEPSGFGYWFMALAPFLFPILLLFGILWFMTRQSKQGGPMQAFSFGQSKARIIYPDDTAQRITFADVAGAKEAKEELREIVDFLKEPKKFLDIGAQIPKGVMLMGAPGTGKTLLARAVAGEAGVPFFHLSGSEFVEMFVGVGASRVRDLFRLAKKEAPAIIFVDEIDAVGRARGAGMGGGNDEREQTLNQILVEMDGFEPNEKVIVMAATNRPDVLDTALLRPGRFDRRVTLDLPDLADREEILGVHVRNKKLAEDVVLRTVAERTPGFSGADLYSLVNEAAILAARENRKHVAQFDFIRSIEKVMIGPERKSHILSEDEKKVTAYHEGGHALVASLLPYADPVHKISIISRGHAAGYTLKLPTEERRFHTRNEFLDDIAVSLGGYVAEEMMFDDLTTGPSNDLAVATNLARDMVSKYGMSALIGPVAFEQGGVPMLNRRGYDGDYSQEVASRIDSEVSRIMNEQLKRVRALLAQYKNVLDAIATALVEKETMEREEYEQILILSGIRPKKRHGEEAYLISRSGIAGVAKPIAPAKNERTQVIKSASVDEVPTPEAVERAPEEHVIPPGEQPVVPVVRHDSVEHTITPNASRTQKRVKRNDMNQ
ncbi:MAG TPA: ATP-dependent zinc metalloprotease FtsH [Candidatus Paceibacterota bacterium]|nr:ATP-dependent zinc metalloprotease FtsH [Candidatus Paceibacterota bacterium]